MTVERWRQIETIFQAAAERERAARPKLLDEACGGDRELRAELDALLGSIEESEEFLAVTVERKRNCLRPPARRISSAAG